MTEKWTLHTGDCLEVMRTLAPDSVDAIVTDPPYGLEFMGKDWDSFRAEHAHANPNRSGAGLPRFGSYAPYASDAAIAKLAQHRRSFGEWCEVWATEALRVIKPGGHILAFGGTRTHHRLMCALEDAGWEIRDTLMWMYGSGFPKSLSVHKATRTVVESKYGNLRCDCLDARDGRVGGDGCGREDRYTTRTPGGPGPVQTNTPGPSSTQTISGSSVDAVRELRSGNHTQTQGFAPEQEAVLFANMLERRTETEGYGHASVWSGVEEHQGKDSAKGHHMQGVRSPSDRERTPRSSLETVQGGWDEHTKESGGALRFVSPCDRSDHDVGIGRDPNRRESRRVHHDDHGGGIRAVAWVCSWCGLPDREWLDSLMPLGTALKPAYEPIVLARKPLIGTVATNVTKHGVGGLNIDGCRIHSGPSVGGSISGASALGQGSGWNEHTNRTTEIDRSMANGRWPSNVILDCVDDQVLSLMNTSLVDVFSEVYANYDPLRMVWYATGSFPVQAEAVALLQEKLLRIVAEQEQVGRKSPHVRQRALSGVDCEDACNEAVEPANRTEECGVGGRETPVSRVHDDCTVVAGRRGSCVSAGDDHKRQGLRTRTPPNGSEKVESAASHVGGGASRQREEVGQSFGEPGVDEHGYAQEGAPCSGGGFTGSEGGDRRSAFCVVESDVPAMWRRYFVDTGRSVRCGSAAMLDAQTGNLAPGASPAKKGLGSARVFGDQPRAGVQKDREQLDGGGASRFFYCAKTSKSERNGGVENNNHPTVKPIALMQYLVRLVTPPNGLVLDPFNGSGTTGCATVLEGFRYLGIEQNPEYVAIAEKRIAHWETQKELPAKKQAKPKAEKKVAVQPDANGLDLPDL